MDTPFPWKCSVHHQFMSLAVWLSLGCIQSVSGDRLFTEPTYWGPDTASSLKEDRTWSRKWWHFPLSFPLFVLPQEQPWQEFTCHASLCFLPHPSLSLFGNVMDHLESRIWALEVHIAPGHCACFSSCILIWKTIIFQITKSLVLGVHHVPYPQANLKITDLLGHCLLDFKESSPAWSHKELKWVWRQKVEKGYCYLLISRDEKWLERSKQNYNGMVRCSGSLLLINR